MARLKEANEKLDKEIKEEYEKSKGRYGSPKIQKMLEKREIKASQKRIARRMKKERKLVQSKKDTFIN